MSELSTIRHGLTAAQREVWLAQQLDPRGTHYKTGSCLEIDGPLDHARLTAALRRTLAETETLCSRFLTDEDGRPYRSYCPPAAGGHHRRRSGGRPALHPGAAAALRPHGACRP